jgi:hypothetical protein
MAEHGIIRGTWESENIEGETLENLRSILDENERLKSELKSILDMNLKESFGQ